MNKMNSNDDSDSETFVMDNKPIITCKVSLILFIFILKECASVHYHNSRGQTFTTRFQINFELYHLTLKIEI